MILALATLVSGPRHEKYAAGRSLPAVLFINANTDDEAEAIASRELGHLGWASMSIERYKDITDHEQFNDSDTTEALAFREALSTGFSIIVFPQTGGT